MTDSEMIAYARCFNGTEIICPEQYDYCDECPKEESCLPELVLPQICNRLQELVEVEKKYNLLKQLIDDSSMDHVCDYLEWYFEENEKLNNENENLHKDLLRAMNNEIDACDVCDNRIECGGKECDCYEEGVGATDKNGKEFPDFKWNCMDWDFGTCGKMEGTPCEGCDLENHFVYKGCRQK